MEKIDIIKLLPKKNPRINSDIVFSINRNKVKLWWINKNKKGKILNPQNQPKPIKVPRFINLSEHFGEIMGLYFGDGTKNDSSCVEFSNSRPELLLMWIDFLKKFKINKSNLKYKVRISRNAELKYFITEDEIRNYWRDVLKLPKKSEIKIAWVDTPGKPSEYLQQYGSMTLRYFNTVFAFFVNLLIQNVDYFIKKSKKFLIGFLRGKIATDGNVNFKTNGSLNLVRIAGDSEERKFVSYLFWKYFRIKTKDERRSNQIYFSSLRNFKKIKKLRLFDLNSIKKKQFEKGYKTLIENIKNLKPNKNVMLKNRKSMELLFLLSKTPLTNKQLKKLLKISDRQIRRILNGYTRKSFRYNGLRNLGLVRSIENGRQKLWIITKKGKDFLIEWMLEYSMPYISLELESRLLYKKKV
jgi:hypothetical protein